MPDPRAGQPFDATAKARAKALAAAVGKPGTREAGLLAIHAVLQKKRFRVEEDAYLFYSVKRRTFYEWKPLVEAAEAHLNALVGSTGKLLAPAVLKQPAIVVSLEHCSDQSGNTHRAALGCSLLVSHCVLNATGAV